MEHRSKVYAVHNPHYHGPPMWRAACICGWMGDRHSLEADADKETQQQHIHAPRQPLQEEIDILIAEAERGAVCPHCTHLFILHLYNGGCDTCVVCGCEI